MAKKTTTVIKDKIFGFGYTDMAAQIATMMDTPISNPYDLSRYSDMQTDDAVSTGLEYLSYSIISKIHSYSNEDERIKDFVDRCIERIDGTIEAARNALIFNALCYGYGLSEFSMTPEGGQWVLSSIQSYNPATLKFKFNKGLDNATIISGIEQTAGGQLLNIPAEKVMIFRTGGNSNPYGKSRLERCWRWYVFKKAIPKFWAVALERFGMPTLVGHSDDTEAMAEVLKDAYSKAYFAIGPSDVIEPIPQSGAGLSGGYETALDVCNKMIYRSMFIPPLLSGGESGGSYSLGQVHWQMFDDACMWLAREYAEAELEQLWKPLIEWNFGPQEQYGEIDVSNTDTPEKQLTLSQIYKNGIESGYIYPDEGDAEWLRERLKFPAEKTGGEKVAWRSKFSRNPSQNGEGANA